MTKRRKKKLNNYLEFSGNVPLKTFKSNLNRITDNDKLLELELKFESKKRNIDLIQKIYWWILTVLSAGIVVSGIYSLRLLSENFGSFFPKIIGNWFIFLIAYFVLMVVIEIVIQTEKNTIYTHLSLIKDKVNKDSNEQGK